MKYIRIKLSYSMRHFLEMCFGIRRFWNKAKSRDEIKNIQKKVSKLKCILQNLLVKLKNKITHKSVVIYLLEFLTRSFFRLLFASREDEGMCYFFSVRRKFSENLRNLQCLKNFYSSSGISSSSSSSFTRVSKFQI